MSLIATFASCALSNDTRNGATVFLGGAAFRSDKQPHDELAFELGLPEWYGRNLDALLDGLSSIYDPHENLCIVSSVVPEVP